MNAFFDGSKCVSLVWFKSYFGALLFGIVLITQTLQLQANDWRAGQVIYQQGKIKTGKVSVGEPASEAPSTLFACENCHGAQAQGSKEGGVSAPEITWFRLSATARRDSEGGQRRLAYDKASFQRLLSEGVSSSGKSLSGFMPRYELKEEEVDTLIAYLKYVDAAAVPGVSDRQISLGVLLSQEPGYVALKIAVNAYFNDVNQFGGIYGRQISLHFLNSAQMVNEESLFALLNFNNDASQLQEQKFVDAVSLPVIGLFAGTDIRENQFYLYGDGEIRHQVLEQFISGQFASGENVQSLYAEDGDFFRQLEQFQKKKQPPILVLKGRLLGRSLNNKSLIQALFRYPAAIYAAMPPTPHLVDKQGLWEYRQLAKQQELPTEHLTLQLWGIASAKVMTQALRASGRKLQQQVFQQMVVRLYDFETHVGPTLRFLTNRRLAAPGATIVRLDGSAGADDFHPRWQLWKTELEQDAANHSQTNNSKIDEKDSE